MANNQYVNKVSYVENGTPRVLIDISNDTVTPSTLVQGYSAHDASGAPISGTLSFVTYYTSTSAPTSSYGSDGDIWLVTE